MNHPETAPELRIEIRRDDWAEYTGTAAQLQAEGLIPDGFEWPQANCGKYWAADGFEYGLSRTRPAGHKGPMSSWLALDSWLVRVTVAGRGYHWQTARHLARMAEALQAECYRHTPEGTRQRDAAFRRYWQSVEDKRFQAFKALVPGLVPPKRGRKPKARGEGQGPAMNGAASAPPAAPAGATQPQGGQQ